MINPLIAVLMLPLVLDLQGRTPARTALVPDLPLSRVERGTSNFLVAPRSRPRLAAIAVQRQQAATKPNYRRALLAGLASGAALGAVEGAMLGRTIGEEGATLGMAFVVAGLGGASGALTGLAIAALPERRGWKRHLQAAAAGLVIAGLGYRAFGTWIDDPGLGAREFGRTGLVHGAVNGIILVEIGVGR